MSTLCNGSLQVHEVTNSSRKLKLKDKTAPLSEPGSTQYMEIKREVHNQELGKGLVTNFFIMMSIKQHQHCLKPSEINNIKQGNKINRGNAN